MIAFIPSSDFHKSVIKSHEQKSYILFASLTSLSNGHIFHQIDLLLLLAYYTTSRHPCHSTSCWSSTIIICRHSTTAMCTESFCYRSIYSSRTTGRSSAINAKSISLQISEMCYFIYFCFRFLSLIYFN